MKLNRKTIAFGALAGASLVAALLPPAPAFAYSGAFLSSPHQSSRTSVSGSNLVVSNKSWVGFTAGACLTVHDAVNVDLTNLDFDGCGGGIFLINVTGRIHVEGIRCRNIGNGNIGSGQGNCIQFNNSWQGAPGGVNPANGYALVRSIKVLGGDTEDMISVYKSGGVDAQHPMVIGDVHLESPLPPDPNAWSSSSSTCVNLADSSGHDILYRNSTALNCGAVGEQINHCSRCTITHTTVYGAQRSGSNVGLSRYSSCTCAGNVISYNRVYWINAAGRQNSTYNGSPGDTTFVGNTTADATIDPAKLGVVL